METGTPYDAEVTEPTTEVQSLCASIMDAARPLDSTVAMALMASSIAGGRTADQTIAVLTEWANDYEWARRR